jgi:hypothetical protein
LSTISAAPAACRSSMPRPLFGCYEAGLSAFFAASISLRGAK